VLPAIHGQASAQELEVSKPLATLEAMHDQHAEYN